MNEGQLKEIIKNNIENKNAPGLLRLAFHDSGTFCKHTKTGGVSGSITNSIELSREENDGLQKSADLVSRLKEDIPDVSLSDIIAVAGAVAVEICGGPTIDVGLGREDNLEVSPDGRLPDENDEIDHLKNTFDRMGLSTKDLVVLSGAHTLGDARDKPFTDDRLTFNNNYFKNLLKEELPEKLGRFKSDEALKKDDESFELVKKYAENEELFFNDFVESYQRMTKLGYK